MIRQSARQILAKHACPECNETEREVNILSIALQRFQAVLAKKAALRDSFKSTDGACEYRCALLYEALKRVVSVHECECDLCPGCDEAKRVVNSIDRQLSKPLSYPKEPQ